MYGSDQPPVEYLDPPGVAAARRTAPGSVLTAALVLIAHAPFCVFYGLFCFFIALFRDSSAPLTPDERRLMHLWVGAGGVFSFVAVLLLVLAVLVGGGRRIGRRGALLIETLLGLGGLAVAATGIRFMIEMALPSLLSAVIVIGCLMGRRAVGYFTA
jgi:hypothetical protein